MQVLLDEHPAQLAILQLKQGLSPSDVVPEVHAVHVLLTSPTPAEQLRQSLLLGPLQVKQLESQF